MVDVPVPGFRTSSAWRITAGRPCLFDQVLHGVVHLGLKSWTEPAKYFVEDEGARPPMLKYFILKGP